MLNVRKRCYFVRHVSSQEPYKCTLVPHLVAVVRSREYSKHSASLLVFVAVLFALVGADQHFYTAQGLKWTIKLTQSIFVQKLSSNVRSKLGAHTTLGRRPAHRVLGVRPEQLAHYAWLWRLSPPIDSSDLLQSDAVAGEETPVSDHYFLVYHAADWQLAE